MGNVAPRSTPAPDIAASPQPEGAVTRPAANDVVDTGPASANAASSEAGTAASVPPWR